MWLKNSKLSLLSGFAVNGQIIGKKKVVQDGNTNTYFGRFGIVHQKLRLRLEVSTQEIFVFHEEKQIKLLWSDTDSVREMKWVTVPSKYCWTITCEWYQMIYRIIYGVLFTLGSNKCRNVTTLFISLKLPALNTQKHVNNPLPVYTSRTPLKYTLF